MIKKGKAVALLPWTTERLLKFLHIPAIFTAADSKSRFFVPSD